MLEVTKKDGEKPYFSLNPSREIYIYIHRGLEVRTRRSRGPTGSGALVMS